MNKATLQSLLPNMAVFAEVATWGSFSAAATRLQMTPSSVSKRITQLEDTLGAKLIERTTRSMRLTATGAAFLIHCQSMLAAAQGGVEMATGSQQDLAGDIRIGVPKAFASHVLQPILAAFFAQYPKINLHILVTDAALDLLREPIDCAIDISNSPPPYVIARPLITVNQVLCATPHYLQANPYPILHPSDLQQHACLTLGETPNDQQWQFAPLPLATAQADMDTVAKTVNDNATATMSVTVAVTGRYAVNHTGMRLAGILQHLGVGCLPDFVAKPALLSGEVIEVLPHWHLQSKYQGTAWLTYLPNKFQSLRLQALIGFLQDNV